MQGTGDFFFIISEPDEKCLMKFVISLYYLCWDVHSGLVQVNMESEVFASMVYMKITFDFHTLNLRKEGFENLEKICRYLFQNSAEILKKLPKNFEIEDSK